jgi:hypothetical protein
LIHYPPLFIFNLFGQMCYDPWRVGETPRFLGVSFRVVAGMAGLVSGPPFLF